MARIPKLDAAGKFLAADVNAQLDARTKATMRADLPALAKELKIGGSGSGIEEVSGTVTLDTSGAPIREFYTTGATTFKANGADTLISSFTAVVWRRNAQGSWGYQIVQETWTTPAPTPDTTAPVAGTLAVTVADVKADLSVSGASDDRGYVQYSFSKDNGATWTAYQDSATYTFTGLTASTAYQFRHRVKDAANNVTTGAAVSKTTLAVISDTTAPVAGALAVSTTDTTANLVVSGASDDRGSVSYAFSKDNGATWTAYQDSATYTFTGLTEQTTYTFKHRVKDAAGNTTDGTAVTKTTTTLPTFTTLSAAIKHMGPVGYWKLDETGGTQATDSSGNNRHGTYSGAVTLAARAGAPAFAGGHVNVGDAPEFSVAGSTAGFSIFAIAQPDGVPTARQFIVSKGAAGAYEWQMDVVANSSKSETAIYRPTGDVATASTVDGVVPTAANALCATLPNPVSGARLSIYRNNATPLTPTSTIGSDGQFANLADTATPVIIGDREASPQGAFKGSIRHVAIFRKQLTATQVGQLMNAARQEGLIA